MHRYYCTSALRCDFVFIFWLWSAFYLNKQKKFVSKEYAALFWGEQHFFVCPDRNLKFSASFWFRISWNITKFQLSIFTNKNVLSKKKWGMLVIETLKCKIYHSNTCFSSRLYGTYSNSKNLTSPLSIKTHQFLCIRQASTSSQASSRMYLELKVKAKVKIKVKVKVKVKLKVKVKVKSKSKSR